MSLTAPHSDTRGGASSNGESANRRRRGFAVGETEEFSAHAGDGDLLVRHRGQAGHAHRDAGRTASLACRRRARHAGRGRRRARCLGSVRERGRARRRAAERRDARCVADGARRADRCPRLRHVARACRRASGPRPRAAPCDCGHGPRLDPPRSAGDGGRDVAVHGRAGVKRPVLVEIVGGLDLSTSGLGGGGRQGWLRLADGRRRPDAGRLRRQRRGPRAVPHARVAERAREAGIRRRSARRAGPPSARDPRTAVACLALRDARGGARRARCVDGCGAVETAPQRS